MKKRDAKEKVHSMGMPIFRLGFARFIVVAISIFASVAFADKGRAMADSWPALSAFRELELRGHVPLQPNVWPLRSGRMIAALPDSSVDATARLWTGELRRRLESARILPDTIGLIVEPGVEGILNDPRDPDDRLYPTLRLGGGMRKGPVEGFVTYMVNLRWAKEKNYRGRQWSGFAGRPDQVYLRVDGDDWGVQFGKDYLSWGEGMILGTAHDPFNRIDYQMDIGHFRFSGFSGWLDPVYCYKTIGDALYWDYARRYLAGHRLEFLSRHFSIALHETMLYGGFGRSLEAIYTVPFFWYHAQQLNLGLDDNTFVGGDIQLLFPPVRFSGELLVDDIQVESQTQADEEPPEVALAVQADLGTSLFERWLTFSARYEGVTNWTYNQNKVWNRYLYMEEPLGSGLGNDVDMLSVGARFFARPELIIGAKAFYKRKGEGEIEAYWAEPWLDVEGDYNPPFPTGIVEKTTGMRVDLSGDRWPYCSWDANFEYGSIQNSGHEEGARSDYWQLGMSLKGGLYPLFKQP
ncbi:hypothetical protein J7L01_02950 [bacterium]|nr:hypothetical protein [bacterium]